MNDNLRRDLADLAMEATVVDLRDRALRTSRKLGVLRALLATGAVLVVLAGVGGVVMLRPGDGDRVGPGVTTSARGSSSPTRPGPSHSPAVDVADFAFPDPPSSATRPGPWATTPADTLPGHAYFLIDGATDAIAVLGDGQLRTSSLGALDPVTSCLLNTMVVSPDGTHIAWVRGDIMTGGQLVSVDLATRRAFAIGENASCQGGIGPKWRPDSRSIIFTTVRGRVAVVREVNIKTGATTTPRDGTIGYRAMSESFSAYATSGTTIAVEDAHGIVIRTASYTRYGTAIGLSVQGISSDGRYVGVSHRNTDPSIVRSFATIVDTVTGQVVDVPAPAGETVTSIRFGHNGALLVQSRASNGTQRLSLVAADGTTTASVIQTGAIAHAELLSYVP